VLTPGALGVIDVWTDGSTVIHGAVHARTAPASLFAVVKVALLRPGDAPARIAAVRALFFHGKTGALPRLMAALQSIDPRRFRLAVLLEDSGTTYGRLFLAVGVVRCILTRPHALGF
jgi:hypothetical protein